MPSDIITYVLDLKLRNGNICRQEWRSKRRGIYPGHGRPTAANIGKFMIEFNNSARSESDKATAGSILDQRSWTIVAELGDMYDYREHSHK